MSRTKKTKPERSLKNRVGQRSGTAPGYALAEPGETSKEVISFSRSHLRAWTFTLAEASG
jgi:hypothetical protein